MSRHARRRAPFVLVLALALAAVACAGGDSDEGSQPAPEVTTFEQGVFDDIPLFPRSEPLGPRSEEGGTVAQSFRATGTTPRGVLEHYVGALPQWDLVEPITQTGATNFRARWVRDGWALLVTSGPAPTVSDGNPAAPPEADAQYSLTLSPT